MTLRHCVLGTEIRCAQIASSSFEREYVSGLKVGFALAKICCMHMHIFISFIGPCYDLYRQSSNVKNRYSARGG